VCVQFFFFFLVLPFPVRTNPYSVYGISVAASFPRPYTFDRARPSYACVPVQRAVFLSILDDSFCIGENPRRVSPPQMSRFSFLD